jgi:hypothetical protein
MRWFRGHSRLDGWAALVAIALQLVLAFGHVHTGALGHNPKIAALMTADGAHAGQRQKPATPSDQDYCSICAVLSLLSGAQGATTPALPVPAATAAVALVAEPETVRAAALRPAFRSRAPPLA